MGLDEVDTSYAYELVRDMAATLPPVWAGSPKERKAVDYITNQLSDAGISVRELHLRGHVSHPGPGTLSLVGEGVDEPIRCNVLAQSEPTPELVAEAVYVGSGGFADYGGMDATGKIVIVDLNYSPPRPEKMRIAKLRGAVGMLMINWGKEGDESLPFGTTKYVWGNPTRATASDMITLPAVAVTRPDGNLVRRRLSENPSLKLRITSTAERKWRELVIPVAWIGEGEASGREFVLTAGHYDSWGGGATDNLSGDAALIAMAKYFQANKENLLRDVVVAWWPAHESGIMIGSTWFADSQWRTLRDRCVAYINVDQLGMGELTRWYVESAGELKSLIRAADAPDDTEWSHPLKTGDQSFFGVGLPSTNTYSGATEQQKREANGMSLGWWYHSENDTFDKLNPTTYAEGIRYIVSYIEVIATTPLLPFDVAEAAEEIVGRLDEIDAELRRIGWDPDSDGYPWSAVREEAGILQQTAKRFRAELERLSDDATEVANANRAIRRFSRATIPVRYSATDSYGQDSYGQSRLAHILPELEVLIERAATAEGDETRYFMDAEIYRALNRLSDALVTAIDALVRPGER